MNVAKLPLSWFCDQLVAGTPFSFARYGDGEWLAMLGAQGKNCDGHTYFPELGAELRHTLSAPLPYLHAIGPKATHFDEIGPAIAEFIARHCPALPWCSSETFLEASLKGELYPLVAALAGRRVLFVGPEHLRRLSLVQRLVTVPAVNCYLSKARIEDELRREAAGVDVIAFSAGMTTKVLIYNLYPEWGETHTLVDFGSLWDMYCGVDSRRYARRMGADIKTLLYQQNFEVVHAR